MKKIFTLLFAVGLLTAAANAQQGSQYNQPRDQRTDQQTRQKDDPRYDPKNDQQNSQWDKNNSYSNGNDDRYDKSYRGYGRGLEMQVAQINRKYDFQIQRVKNDFFMRRYEKMRTIRFLEDRRQQEIGMLYARSNNRHGHDRDYDSHRHY
jgi:hypothetical protein